MWSLKSLWEPKKEKQIVILITNIIGPTLETLRYTFAIIWNWEKDKLQCKLQLIELYEWWREKAVENNVSQ